MPSTAFAVGEGAGQDKGRLYGGYVGRCHAGEARHRRCNAARNAVLACTVHPFSVGGGAHRQSGRGRPGHVEAASTGGPRKPSTRARTASQPPIDRLPEHEPVDRVLAPAGVAERAGGDIVQPERVIRLTHRRQNAVPTELRSPEFQPHTAVEIHPIIPRGTRTFQAIRKTRLRCRQHTDF